MWLGNTLESLPQKNSKLIVVLEYKKKTDNSILFHLLFTMANYERPPNRECTHCIIFRHMDKIHREYAFTSDTYIFIIKRCSNENI